MKQLKNIAIIPIRSGSKGIPDKNIKLLDGVPLVAYTIKAALESKRFDTVMVSTDSEKYAEISRQYGAEVPFLRSAATSSDTASSWSVVREVLDNYKAMGVTYETLGLLQATSPLRRGIEIIHAFEEMEKKNANAILSISESKSAFNDTFPENLSLECYSALGSKYRPRQSLRQHYHVNGAIYLYKVAAFYEQDTIFDSKCYGFITGKIASTDIDDIDDFRICSALINEYPEYKY